MVHHSDENRQEKKDHEGLKLKEGIVKGLEGNINNRNELNPHNHNTEVTSEQASLNHSKRKKDYISSIYITSNVFNATYFI